MVEKEQLGKCCVHSWRITFIVLNVLFFLIGLALLGLAIFLLATQNDLTILTGSRIASGATLILIAGIITSIISFLGILGAIGMWPALLIVYIVLLFVIVVLEIVAGILGFVYQTDLVEVAAVRANDTIFRYLPEEDPDFRNDVNTIVDFLQNRFQCCGYVSPEQWLDTDYFNLTRVYPDSCNCTETSEDMMGQGDCRLENNQLIYSLGCNGSFNEFLNGNLIVVGSVGIAFGLFEVIGIGVAIALTCCFCIIRKNKDDYEFTKAV